MKTLDFKSLSAGKREQMSGFVASWKKSATNLNVLEESLRLLASSPRQRAFQLSEDGSKASMLACTYGKGQVPKLALGKEDAEKLLTLVQGVKEAYQDGRSPPRDILADIISAVIKGTEPEQTGKVRQGIMKVLRGIVSDLSQCSLF